MTLSAIDQLGRHEARALGGERMLELIAQVGRTAPQLGRFLLVDGFGSSSPSMTVGYRDWALMTCTALAVVGDAGDQLEVYGKIAVEHGATADELLDVVNLVSLYAGAPRGVNATRRLAGLLTATEDETVGVESVITLGDHQTGVRDNGGGGPPILLIHALSMDHRFWRKIYPVLARSNRVVSYDIRGHGRARAAPLTLSLDHVAADAIRLLDQLGIEQADVYGASYGGAIAQHVALKAADRIRSMALIATGSKAPFDELDGRAIAAEKDGMEAQVAPSVIRWFLPETIATDPWEVRYARNCVRRARVEDWAAAWRAMARLDVIDAAGALEIPVLALGGRQDASATPDAMEICARAYPKGELRFVDPGTHMMPMEQWEAVADELSAFRMRVDLDTASS